MWFFWAMSCNELRWDGEGDACVLLEWNDVEENLTRGALHGLASGVELHDWGVHLSTVFVPDGRWEVVASSELSLNTCLLRNVVPTVEVSLGTVHERCALARKRAVAPFLLQLG